MTYNVFSGTLNPTHFTSPTPLLLHRWGWNLAWRRGPLLHAKFYPHQCNVSPLRGEKPHNRPLSKLNTGRFALHAMLPVKTDVSYHIGFSKNASEWNHAFIPENISL